MTLIFGVVPLFFYECEADARHVRRIARVDQDEDLLARDIGCAMGVRFSRSGASGCEGQADALGLHVYSSGCGKPATRNFSDGHELNHIVLELQGTPSPHDEDRVDWGTAALLMPRAHVRATIARVGLHDIDGLLAAYPLMPPAWALLRVAWVARRPVVLYLSHQRRAWAPEGYRVPCEPTWWELRAKRVVRATGLPAKVLQGVHAVPVGKDHVEGVLIFYPSAEPTGW